MLSYQHIYHAGSIIDVQKHFILSQLLNFLSNTAKVSYLETHSGRGVYNLQSSESQKTKEYIYGVDQIYNLLKEIIDIKKNVYFNLLDNVKEIYGKNYYPGSPLLAKYLLKEEHKKYFFELHKGEFSFLEKTFKNNKNIYLKNDNGFDCLKFFKFSKNETLVVFIDPSYEIKEDYTKVFKLLTEIIKLYPKAIVGIWYPILKNNYYKQLQFNLNSLSAYGVEKFSNSEEHKENTITKLVVNKYNYFNFHNTIMFSNLNTIKVAPNNRMLGTGMFIYNAPIKVEKLLKQINLIIF